MTTDLAEPLMEEAWVGWLSADAIDVPISGTHPAAPTSFRNSLRSYTLDISGFSCQEFPGNDSQLLHGLRAAHEYGGITDDSRLSVAIGTQDPGILRRLDHVNKNVLLLPQNNYSWSVRCNTSQDV